METGVVKESLVTFQNSQGNEGRGNLLRLSRHAATFEVYSLDVVLRTSEVLQEFKIFSNERVVYSGRAVVRDLVNAGTVVVCEANLDDLSFDAEFFASVAQPGQLRARFDDFVREWQKVFQVRPEFKAVVADMQSFLSGLRLWLDQVELGIRTTPSADCLQLEHAALGVLTEPIGGVIDMFVDRFETIAAGAAADLQPIYRVYLRRQLHPLVLCSPFANRTFHKPLGYAGDYEMVDMMLRSPQEGSTLFAKVINTWLLGQSPAQAHRNRVEYLTRKLVETTVRTQARGRVARVFNLGCGPAGEVLRFLSEYPGCEHANLTLLDFNEETLQHLRRALEAVQRQHHRRTPLKLIKKSVHQILKEADRPVTRVPEEQYDLVYCAGLFDYLSDQVCRQLMNIFYARLAPGGLLLATNVSDVMNASRPFRYSMEYLLDWHLIYRNAQRVTALAPERATRDNVTVISEDLGVNIFLEVRKPNDA